MDKEPFLDRMMRWMSHDVKICMANDAYIGAMTLMMTDIAALAGFYAGREKEKPEDDHNEFERFFRDFFNLAKDSNYHDLIYYLDEEHRNKLVIYDHFRCGLVHEHLMKSGNAVDKGLTKPYVFFSEGGLTINVDHFYIDYLSVLKRYSKKVRSDKTISDNFKKRARFLQVYEPYF